MGVTAIISLITTIAPKLISAGISIYDIWKDAGDLIDGAEKNGGVVDPVGYAALVDKCNEMDAILQKRADEARNNA